MHIRALPLTCQLHGKFSTLARRRSPQAQDCASTDWQSRRTASAHACIRARFGLELKSTRTRARHPLEVKGRHRPHSPAPCSSWSFTATTSKYNCSNFPTLVLGGFAWSKCWKFFCCQAKHADGRKVSVRPAGQFCVASAPAAGATVVIAMNYAIGSVSAMFASKVPEYK